jgi:hypothetical protein
MLVVQKDVVHELVMIQLRIESESRQNPSQKTKINFEKPHGSNHLNLLLHTQIDAPRSALWSSSQATTM